MKTSSKAGSVGSRGVQSERSMRALLRRGAAIQLAADLDLLEILEDSISVDQALRFVIDAAADEEPEPDPKLRPHPGK